ncbi:iron-containing alcohol dehydrogenase [Rhizobium sp.]|uniref:iron-containing alcohol dehydrogenase n=1 Tax=Rhizobium sp. TaxID=391 RepID=UPI0034C6321F
MLLNYVFAKETGILFSRDVLGAESRQRVFATVDSSSPVFIITDPNVDRLYGDKISARLSREGFQSHRFVAPHGEVAKSIKVYDDAVTFCIEKGVNRQSTIVAFGGGVVGNLAGMLAATIYRGINFINIPTTLLNQTDAAIDFKQALNTSRGKNLVGLYYPPSAVLVDTAFLQTLDKRYLIDGMAEGLKHGLCHDSEFIFEFSSKFRTFDDAVFLDWFVQRSVENKIKTMGSSGKSLAQEAIKQYGHSIGHAIEHLNYPDCLHGESVAIGMVCSAIIADLLGVAPASLIDFHRKLFKSVGLPTYVPSASQIPEILDVMRVDKYNLNGLPTMGLIRDIGAMAVAPNPSGFSVAWDLVERALLLNVDPSKNGS